VFKVEPELLMMIVMINDTLVKQEEYGISFIVSVIIIQLNYHYEKEPGQLRIIRTAVVHRAICGQKVITRVSIIMGSSSHRLQRGL
jgi:hypothetical protein